MGKCKLQIFNGVDDVKKTMKVMAGISSTAMALSLIGCGSNLPANAANIPNAPTDAYCKDWAWDRNDGVWGCNDRSSSYYGQYYHAGKYYAGKSDLQKSKEYLDYRNSSAFKSATMSEGSTGFGSGSSSSGGS